MKKFDFLIIGAGSAGFAAAIKANELGAKTAMVNDGLPLGGTCVNVGCVPSKTLLHIAEFANHAKKNPPPGVSFSSVDIDFAKAVEHELGLVEKFRKEKYEDVLKRLPHVKLIEGKAKFVGEKEIDVNGEKVTSEHFLIANGTTAVTLPIPGLDKVEYLTHVEALKIKELPKSLIVIGGGPVALEFAQMYAHFGSKVTILQRSQILKDAEPEISRGLFEILKDEGIEIFEGVEFLQVGQNESSKFVKIKIGATYKEMVITGEALLVGTGKKPNTKELGLEKVGVEVEKNGAIKVNEMMKSKNPNIFAAGDVVFAPKRLETTAAKEGNIVADNALKGKKRKITYNDIPSVVFTTPAVASVGFTDQEAVKAGIACNCTTIPMSLVPKSHLIGDTRGVIKMVIDNNTKKIVGVHILAKDAGDLIHEATLAVKFGLTTHQIIDTVHVFPTLSEATKLVATSFDKDIAKLSCCIE
jgi:mercuric reductase